MVLDFFSLVEAESSFSLCPLGPEAKHMTRTLRI